jgi:hypothetical protein
VAAETVLSVVLRVSDGFLAARQLWGSVVCQLLTSDRRIVFLELDPAWTVLPTPGPGGVG